jgi:hypothetical protein
VHPWKAIENAARSYMRDFEDDNVILLRKIDAMEVELKKLRKEHLCILF